MDNLLCHSGMLLGSITTLAVVAGSIGGLGLLVASALRRSVRKA